MIVDHGTGRLVWAAEGRNSETLGRFVDDLGAEGARLLTLISCDGIHTVVHERASRRCSAWTPTIWWPGP
ncbi:hypothetical protein MGAST_18360 [Mycobacterium gastri 'Wayne']|uniref:Uncharacterized protein n=1 Tax=Mycobacterium gastri TaxID=1777 RepID=A0A1X1VE09_MYCGS|nr:hypothetical protein MGAST_18360 [Mycobacterium gastri 'Wayne']ORV67276.1 hypothetical protein AWC07_09720 [Mycobacterium gastri]